MSDDTTPNDDSNSSGFPRWLKWGLIGALGILIVGYGLIFLYAKVINDSPDELDEGDLDAALSIDDTADEASDEPEAPEDAPEGSAPAPAEQAPAATEPPAAEEAPNDEAAAGDGVWVATDASEFGYRVKEVLFGVDTDGVGRSNQITGSITIEGTALTSGEFVVDVASIESDDGRRDNQFRGRIMNTAEFPEAVFTLTEPIELGVEAVEGAEATAEATGELTLKGVTNPVTFEVQAKLENGKIGVLGSIPVVFEDYGIDNPSFGGITTEDNGLLEFVLVFEPAV
jgi:polyisoprenoid-binding protein YceI